MSQKQKHRSPTFLWQGVLILLPVVVLACMGFSFLERDKQLVLQEARENAKSLANQISTYIAPRLETQLRAQDNYASWDLDKTNTTFRRSLSSTSSVGSDSSKTTFRYNVPEQPYHELIEYMRRSGLRPHSSGLVVTLEGALMEPAPYPATPEPGNEKPTFDTNLRPKPIKLGWLGPGGDPVQFAINGYQKFLEAGLQEPFLSRMRFSVANMLEKRHESTKAQEFYLLILNAPWNVTSESGLPIKPLAAWNLLRLRCEEARGKGPMTETLRSSISAAVSLLGSNAVYQPSMLTPMLLQESVALEKETLGSDAASTGWITRWDWDERDRTIFEHLVERDKIHPEQWQEPSAFWMTWNDHEWLVSVVPVREGTFDNPGPVRAFNLRIESKLLIEIAILEMLDESRLRLPSYASVSFEVLGKKFPFTDRPAKQFPYEVNGPWLDMGEAGYLDLITRTKAEPVDVARTFTFKQNELPHFTNATEILARAEGNWITTGRVVATNLTARELQISGFNVQIALADPDAMFTIQRERTRLFTALIGLSAVVAVIGFLTARYAFLRQARLAGLKSNFVSSVSHELRAPIASVRLMAEGLERGKVSGPEKQHEYFRFIGQECRRLSSLIENVLDFSRIDQGRKQYEFEPTDVPKLLSETVKLMMPYAEEKNVHLVLKDDCAVSAGGPVVIDGRAIQQALINLIDNAIKHSPINSEVVVGCKRVGRIGSTLSAPSSRSRLLPLFRIAEERVGERRHDQKQELIALFVEDVGPGIPKNEHEKIFQRFYRLGSELRRETQGIGIGLSIVQHIVESHRGRVVVDSEIGKGSRFTIELPVNGTT